MSEGVREKIGLFCNVPAYRVIEDPDAESIYEVPLLLTEKGLDERVLEILGVTAPAPDLADWRDVVRKLHEPTRTVRIGIVGKYVHLQDAYKSLAEALTHAGAANEARVEIEWVDAETLRAAGPERYLEPLDGILVPGGFGERGIEGKVLAVRYARENRTPYLGICLGLQCAVIEFARNVMGLEGASSREFEDGEHCVIDLMPEQVGVTEKGATMRLGSCPCRLVDGTLAREAYGRDLVHERHRHRYEVNNAYRDALEAAGLRVSGLYAERDLVEIMEIVDHPWFVGVQFHPELKSRPERPHPLFRAFVAASLGKARAGKPATPRLEPKAELPAAG
jgi:CTP synthase